MFSIVLYFFTVTPNSLSALAGYSTKDIILSSNSILSRSPPFDALAFCLEFNEIVPLRE